MIRQSIGSSLWSTRKHAFLSFALSLVFAGYLGVHCARKADIPPKLVVPGYQPRLIVTDQFETARPIWVTEGLGSAILENGMLSVTVPPESEGFVLWLNRNVDKSSFQLEYTLSITDSSGTHGIFFCSEEISGANILSGHTGRTGKRDEYTHGEIRNYQVIVHAMNREGAPLGWSRIRKNPNYYLLSHSETDPCIQPRHYLMDVIKIGNRIQLYVDGILTHDVRDRGGFGQPVYRSGIIGFRFDSLIRPATTRIGDVRVYQLNPI